MGEIFNLWYLVGGLMTLFLIMYKKYITFKKVENDKQIRHIFSITPPSFIEGVIIIIIFLFIFKISYKG